MWQWYSVCAHAGACAWVRRAHMDVSVGVEVRMCVHVRVHVGARVCIMHMQ